MKRYGVNLGWYYRGKSRWVQEFVAVRASSVEAAVGKAIREARLDGWREQAGRTLDIKVRVDGAVLNGERENPPENQE